MKGKIKILAMILMIAMVVSAFAGCNNTGDSTSSGSASGGNESQAGEEYSPKMAEPTTITWYMFDRQPTRSDLVEKANQMSLDAINVQVDFKWTAGNQETINTRLASGAEDMDMIFACSWYAGYASSSANGYFKDITEDFSKYAPDLAEYLPEILVEGVKIGGKLYGGPIWKDTAATEYWYCRTDILEAAGAVEEFQQCNERVASVKPVLEKIKAWHDEDPENNVYSDGCTAPWNFNWVGYNGYSAGWDSLPGGVMLGVKIEDGNTKVESLLADEDFRSDFRAMKEFADLGLTNGKEAVQIEHPPRLEVFNCAQGWDGAQYDSWGDPKKGYSTSISKKSGPYLTSGNCQAGLTCIGVNSPNVEAALKYIQYVNLDEEFRNFMRYGEKGVDWEEVDGRAKILQNDTWLLSNFAIGTLDTLMVPLNVDNDGNAAEEQASVDMYHNVCDEVLTAESSTLMGFTANSEPVNNAIASVSSVMTEMQRPLLCGTVEGDVDAYCDQILERMYELGLQDIIDEYQNQINEFMQSK